jgi:hypothetical protein
MTAQSTISCMHALAHSGFTIDIHAAYHFDTAFAYNDFRVFGYILLLHNIWKGDAAFNRSVRA